MMTKKYVNNLDGNYKYLYYVNPIGKVISGDDKYSIDKCNDYIKGIFKTSEPDENRIHEIAIDFVNKFNNTNEDTELISVIANRCEVLKTIQLK